MLELALLLPLLMLLTGGIIDFARYAYFYIAVSNAAGAGARFATHHPYTPATQGIWNNKTRDAVLDDLQGIVGYNVSKVTVPAPTVTTETTGLQLRRVRVQVDYAFQTLIPWPGFSNSATIRRWVEMRMIR